MTTLELTGLLSAAGAVIAGVGTYFVTVRSTAHAAVASTLGTWKDLATDRKAELDEARHDLDTIDEKYLIRIRVLEEDYQAQLTSLRVRITQLETDLADLTRRYGRPPTTLP